MEKGSREDAYNRLVQLASKQGYVTFDDIMGCADEYSLSIQDFDWLSNSVASRGILIYNEAPSPKSTSLDDEVDDFSQSDYEAVYSRIIELSPSLRDFVNDVRKIVPPQRQEIKQLKYQIVDGNEYARSRMIEMYLRVALRIALQRAELYDMDIEDAVSFACIGLITAVDKYNPDISGVFGSYATICIMQSISRGQSTRRPLVYFPVHFKERYFMVYPDLKAHGCVECDKLWKCTDAKNMVQKRLNCSANEADIIIAQMIPDLSIEEFKEESSDVDLFPDFIDSKFLTNEDEIIFQKIQNDSVRDAVLNAMKILTPREEKVLKMRYGFNGPVMTLEQVGTEFNITRERTRQIEIKALKKLHRYFVIYGYESAGEIK